MSSARAAAEALFKGPVEVRRSRRIGSIHDTRASKLDLPAIAERLRELAQIAGRLTIYRNEPDKFFEDRSELKAGIAAVARQIEGR